MTLTSIALFATALLLTALAPGAIVMAMTSRVVTRGWREVMPLVFAIWIGELVWLTAALAGLSVIAATFQEIFTLLKYLGVAYLLWLAWQAWNASPAEEGELPKQSSAFGMFVAGLMLSLSSPEIMIFYLALLPSLVDLQAVTFQVWSTLMVVTLLVIALADAFWILTAMYGRKFLKTKRAMKLMNRISAGAIGTAAVIIATRQA